MFNNKTAMVAGTALTAGLAVGAMQAQNVQTVHADTVNDPQENQSPQDVQLMCNKHKKIIIIKKKLLII